MTGAYRRPPAAQGRADDGEQHLADVSADQDRHRVAHTGPHAAALDQGVEQHGQVVVGQHDVGGAAGGRRTATAHPDTHVGHPDRGGVVGAVADHRRHSSAALQRPDDLHLLLRADPREHLHVGGQLGGRVLVEAVEVGAGDHPGIGGQPQLTGDRPRGHRVVAGDQHDVAVGLHQRFDQRAR